MSLFWYYSFLFILLLLVAGLGLRVLLYWRQLKKREKNLLKKVEHIVIQAEKKAANTLIEADYLSEALQKDVTSKLDETVDDVADQTHDFFKQLVTAYQKESSHFSTELKARYSKELDQVSKLFSDTITKDAEELSKIFEEEKNKIKADFSQYKQKKHEEYEKQLKLRTDEVIAALLPHQITIKDQEKLILDAIKKAENDGLFK